MAALRRCPRCGQFRDFPDDADPGDLCPVCTDRNPSPGVVSFPKGSKTAIADSPQQAANQGVRVGEEYVVHPETFGGTDEGSHYISGPVSVPASAPTTAAETNAAAPERFEQPTPANRPAAPPEAPERRGLVRCGRCGEFKEPYGFHGKMCSSCWEIMKPVEQTKKAEPDRLKVIEDRRKYYGPTKTYMRATGVLIQGVLESWLQKPIPTIPDHVVGLIFVVIKIARAAFPFVYREDNYIDAHNYLDLAREVAPKGDQNAKNTDDRM